MTRRHAFVSSAPFIGDNRLLKALPFIPNLQLKVIPSLRQEVRRFWFRGEVVVFHTGIDDIGVVIIPCYAPWFVGVGNPSTRNHELTGLIRLKQT